MKLADVCTKEQLLEWIDEVDRAFHGPQDTYYLCTSEVLEEVEEAVRKANSLGLPFEFFSDTEIEGESADGLFVFGCTPK